MWRRLGAVLIAFAAAFTMTGAGSHRHIDPKSENPAAARAVSALTGVSATSVPAGAPISDVIPADFAAVMGYQPKLITDASGSARWVKPAGTCSSPFEVWKRFETACQTHDLGYDLLRYAAVTGGELGPWARKAIDHRLVDDMQARCAESGSATCGVLAATGDAVVRINSWRQGWGVPASEDGTPYVVAVAVIVAAFVVPLRRARWAELAKATRIRGRSSADAARDAGVVITR